MPTLFRSLHIDWCFYDVDNSFKATKLLKHVTVLNKVTKIFYLHHTGMFISIRQHTYILYEYANIYKKLMACKILNVYGAYMNIERI